MLHMMQSHRGNARLQSVEQGACSRKGTSYSIGSCGTKFFAETARTASAILPTTAAAPKLLGRNKPPS